MKTPSTTERKKPRPKPRQAVARDLPDRTERATGGDSWSCGYRLAARNFRPDRHPVGRPQVLARHGAVSCQLNSSTPFDWNGAVSADPLIDDRRGNADLFGERRLRSDDAASFLYRVHALSLAALNAKVNSPAIVLAAYPAA